MGGRELPGGFVGTHAGRLQRVRVELDRERRLGHRDEALAEPGHVDVRVVWQGGLGEQGLDALEQRAARVGRKLAVDHSTLLAGGLVGATLQKAVAVGDPPVFDREAVQHRQPVEPMAHPLLADLELGGTGAQQRARKPAWQLSGQLELIHDHLLLERREAERWCYRWDRDCHSMIPPEWFRPNDPHRTLICRRCQAPRARARPPRVRSRARRRV